MPTKKESAHKVDKGEFSSPESTLGADSYLVSVPPSCYCSGTQKTLLSLQKVQMAGNTETHIHPRPSGVGMGWLCCCPGIVWEPVRKQADTQIVRKHLATVVSACWASVDWSWHKEWNKCTRANLRFQKKKKVQAKNEWLNILPKSLQARKKPPPPEQR